MKKTILLSVSALILAAIVAGCAYYLGLRQQSDTVHALQDKQMERERDYAKALSSIDIERNRALTDYQTACMEYQKLNASYEELYEKAGAASGLSHYLSPDAARGNEDSCYR